MRTLQKRCANGETVCFATDKSGQMSIDSKENFVTKMSCHVNSGNQVDGEFVSSIEKELNARCLAWVRILKLGMRWDQVARVKQAMCSTSLSSMWG